MKQSSEALMGVLTDVKSAVREGKYIVATRNAADLITLAYRLQSKKDLFLGEVLMGVYHQIHRDMVTHEVSDEDKAALNKLMICNLDDLMRAYAAGDDAYGALADMRYNATVFQYATAAKYDYSSPPPSRR